MKEGKNCVICGDESEFEAYMNDSTINVLSYNTAITPTDPGYPDLFRAVVVFECIFNADSIKIVRERIEVLEGIINGNTLYSDQRHILEVMLSELREELIKQTTTINKEETK